MRFSLVLVATAALINMTSGVPASAQSNSGIAPAEFQGEQVFPLNIKETFEPFHWQAVDEDKIVDRVFTFNLAEPAELQITDFMMGGDTYEVLDNDVHLGKTSEIDFTNGETLYANTPEEALNDERFSKAAYALEAGVHEIRLKVAGTINESGTGAVRVVRKTQSLYKKEEGDGDDSDEDDKEDKDDNEQEVNDENKDDTDDKGDKGHKSGKVESEVNYTFVYVTEEPVSQATITMYTTTKTEYVTTRTDITTTVTVKATQLMDLGFLTVA